MSEHLNAVLALPDPPAMAAVYRAAAAEWERYGKTAVSTDASANGVRYEGARRESDLRDYLTHRVSDGARLFIRYIAQASKAGGGRASSKDVRQYARVSVQQQGGYGVSINSAQARGYDPPFERDDNGDEWIFEMRPEMAEAVMGMVDTQGNLI